MSKKFTIQKVQEIVESRGYKLISKKYINAHQKIKILCPKHGVFEMKFCSFKNSKQNCPKCSHKSSRYTIEEVRGIIKEKGCTLISNNYLRNSQKLEIKCSKHGIFKRNLDSFKQSKLGCPKCSIEFNAKKRANTYEYVKSYIEKEGFELITKKNDYKNNKTKLQVKCPRHGVFILPFCNFKNCGTRCSKCSCEKTAKNQRKNIKEIDAWVTNNTDYTLISEKYTNNKSKLQVKCPKHGVFNTRWNRISNGHKCPKCSTIISTQHQEIVDYIKNIYKGSVLVNDRKILGNKEIDIYIPEFNLGIEFDGLYWHSEKVKKNCKKQNKEKAAKIKEKNINILVIFEDEWCDSTKKELIKSMIKYRLGIFKQKIRASKLKLKKLDKNKYFRDFFDKNHLDGHTQASFAYGLFLGEKMISCMSFRRSFSDKCWEIARFASDSNYKIHGNAGKMVKKFKNEYNQKLVTYSNNRLSLGKTYKALGFKEITKTTDPSYYYTDFKTRLWRFKCRRINDPAIIAHYPTEKAQAEGGVFSKKFLGHSKPLYKIYDYGHRKWEL